MVNESQKNDALVLSDKRPPSTNLISRQGIIERLRRGAETRARFVESRLSKDLAFQIRSLRDHEGWSQQELAEKVGMNQNAISRLENPYYGKATITTLKRIAATFDVGLIVQFVPFSELANRASGTPYVEHGLSPETMDVPSFDEEEESGIFNESQSDNDFTVMNTVVVTQTIAPPARNATPVDLVNVNPAPNEYTLFAGTVSLRVLNTGQVVPASPSQPEDDLWRLPYLPEWNDADTSRRTVSKTITASTEHLNA